MNQVLLDCHVRAAGLDQEKHFFFTVQSEARTKIECTLKYIQYIDLL